MVNHTPAPVERPPTRSQRGRSFITPSELDIAIKLCAVAPPVIPSPSNMDPNPNTGMSSQQQEHAGPSENTVPRICDESVKLITNRLTYYEGAVSSSAT